MTSGDLKFKAMYTNFTSVIPLIRMNHHVKYCGFNAKTVACRLVTMSDDQFLSPNDLWWPQIKAIYTNFNSIHPLPKMNPKVNYLDSIAKTAVACRLLTMSVWPNFQVQMTCGDLLKFNTISIAFLLFRKWILIWNI